MKLTVTFEVDAGTAGAGVLDRLHSIPGLRVVRHPWGDEVGRLLAVPERKVKSAMLGFEDRR